jgi:hypothetical protein
MWEPVGIRVGMGLRRVYKTECKKCMGRVFVRSFPRFVFLINKPKGYLPDSKKSDTFTTQTAELYNHIDKALFMTEQTESNFPR